MKESELTVAIDLSASLLKAVYTQHGDDYEMKLETLGVEVIEVEKKWVERYNSRICFKGRVEDEVYVELGKTCYAVGSLARDELNAMDSLRETKYEKGIVRAVAMIGLIAEKLKLPLGFKLNLGIMLPYGEKADKEKFEVKVTTGLKKFKFRGEEYEVAVKNIKCFPEGTGVLFRGVSNDDRLFDSRILILSLGYRNASYMLYEKKKVQEGDTTMLGFHSLLSEVRGMTSGMTMEEVMEVALRYKKYRLNGSGKREFLTGEMGWLKAVMKKNENLREWGGELLSAIEEAEKNYIQALKEWLRTRQFKGIDEVIITGGTANYFREEMEVYFGGQTVNWGEKLENLVKQYLVSEKEYEKEYQYRLTDVCGLFLFLRYYVFRPTSTASA